MTMMSKAASASRPIERYNADMRLWMRLLIWATRNCAEMKA